MSKLVRLVAGFVVLMAATVVAEPSDEVTFRTAAKAPTGFDSWTFFWQMPEIAPDAALTFVVLQPDGKEYHLTDKPLRLNVGKNRVSGLFHMGEGFRSDFRKGSAGGDPSVFHNQHILVRFSVDKGKIKFDPKAPIRFEFRSTVDAVASANSDVSVGNLPPSVVKTVPQCGDTNVDPALSQIAVTFSKDMMEQSCSWCNIPDHRNAFPKLIGPYGNPKYQADKRTCVINVELEPDKTYAIWINMGQYQNFKDSMGGPAVPYLLVFKTRPNK